LYFERFSMVLYSCIFLFPEEGFIEVSDGLLNETESF
jgi:hypothetical protein